MPVRKFESGADQAGKAGMRLPRFLASLRVFVLVFLAVGLASVFTIHADNPSPVGWNLSGGGFCSGTYTIFNTTLTPNPGLYAENCTTGKNDFYSATDFGALFNAVRQALPSGGIIDMRQGFYAAVTTAIFNTQCANGSYCDTGITLNGGYGGTLCCGVGAGSNGTVIIAKTASMTMIEAGPWSPSITTCTAAAGCGQTNCGGGVCPRILGNVIQNLDLQANGLAAIGIDFRNAETSTNNRFLNIHFGTTGATGGGFKTAGMILDGNEDTTVENCYFAGAGSVNPGGAKVDLQWQVPIGNVHISHTLFGGNISLSTWAQNVEISQSTVNNVQLLGTGTSFGMILSISQSYLANIVGVPGIIELNGQTLSMLSIMDDAVRTSSTVALISGTGTITTSDYTDNTWFFGASSNWNSGGATLSSQSSCGLPSGTQAHCNIVISGSAPTNFPFTISTGTF